MHYKTFLFFFSYFCLFKCNLFTYDLIHWWAFTAVATAAGLYNSMPATETQKIQIVSQNCSKDKFVLFHQMLRTTALPLELKSQQLKNDNQGKVVVFISSRGVCFRVVTCVSMLTCRQSRRGGCDPPAQWGRGGLSSALCQNHLQVHEGPDELCGEENFTG